MDNKVGAYAFTVGVVLAVILGLFSAYLGGQVSAILVSLLVLLGLIVGFLNIAGKETKEFLLVAIVLVIATSLGGATATLGGVQYIGGYLVGIFTNIMAFVVPAIIVVGLKDVLRLTKQP